MKYLKFSGIAAAIILLSGCTSTEMNIDMYTSSSFDSTSYVSSLLDDIGASVPEIDANIENRISVSKKETVSSDMSYSVTNKTAVAVKDGGELTVEGSFESDRTSKITVEKGGTLILNGKSSLNCDLTINEGGKLVIGENGVVSGSGTIIVENSFDEIECKGSVTAKIKPPAPVTKDGVTRVGGVLIVNKKYSIPSDFGSELIINDDEGTGLIRDEAYDALLAMREASGYEMPIVSGFRSYNTQKAIYERNYSQYGDDANTFSAKPGESEHQTGFAIDISSLEESYGETEEGKWLNDNCYKFGFIIRYPKGKEPITGYVYEPWHVRYLGESTARLVFDSKLTLEEFLGVN